MYLTYRTFGGEYVLTLHREGGLQHHVTLGSDAVGCVTRVNNALNEIPKTLEVEQMRLEELNRKLEGYSKELGKPFAYEAELEEKSKRLNELDTLLNLDGARCGKHEDIAIPQPVAEEVSDDAFLSNDFPCRIELDGEVFGSASQAYLYFMCKEQDDREKVLAAASPSEAQAAVVGAPVRDGWYFSGSLDAMKDVVEAKFTQNPELAAKLAASDDSALTYKNGGQGKFWSVDANTGEGENHLGKILMLVKEHIADLRNLNGNATARVLEESAKHALPLTADERVMSTAVSTRCR